MSWKTQMLGDKLISDSGPIDTESLDLGDGGVLGLYFSAHWCPPCRTFTPKLATFYNNLKVKGEKKFHIVFVSADRDEDQFNGYFKEMPWHALPFESDQKNAELAKKCGVRGIPKLALFDSNGHVIRMKSDARTMVSNDPQGEDFPWAV